MRVRWCFWMMSLVCIACAQASPALPHKAKSEGRAAVEFGQTPLPKGGSQSAAPSDLAEVRRREPRWLEVMTGSPLSPAFGTNALHDEAGKTWFSLSGNELGKVPAWSIERMHGLSGEKREEFLRGVRVEWAVGDATGPRYALARTGETSCPSEGSFFLERDHQGWHLLDEPPSDRSPPLALSSGDFNKGIVYVDSVNSCGHGGPPMDYDLRTRGAANSWPNPRRFSTKWMTGRQTFSEVAFLAYTITPQGDVVVLGRRRQPDPIDGIAWDGLAVEIFQKGAKKTEIIGVPLEDGGSLEQTTIAAASRREFVVTGIITNSLKTGSYKDGSWSWKDEVPEASVWYQRVHDELRTTPLLVSTPLVRNEPRITNERRFAMAVPFDLHRVFRHANTLWLVGKAGNLDVTFAEGSVRWKTEPAQ